MGVMSKPEVCSRVFVLGMVVQVENRSRLSRDLNTTQKAEITDLGDPHIDRVVKTLNVN